MATYLDLIPLYQESAATVRARMDADVNAGLEPTDAAWLDTREGSFYWDVTQPFVLEIARLWDAIGSEVVAAAMPVLAWGQYLELHASQFGLTRKAAVAATGTVLFTGDAGTLVGAGTIVSADPISDDEDTAVEFETTASGTIATGLLPPGPVSAVADTIGGATLASGVYAFQVTAVNGMGETEGSAEIEATVTGPNGRVTLDWPDVAGATKYRVYMGVGDETKYRIGEPVASTLVITAPTLSAPVTEGPPDINSTAGVRIAVVAREPGTIGNVPARAITNIDTPNDGVNQVVNEAALSGGLEEESDEALRGRVLARYAGQGGGNITDYELWSLDYPGVGQVSVIPLASGPGTVGVVALQEDGTAVPAGVVSGLQAYLDPVSQQGKGRAPIGHAVTVSTPSIRQIEITATITFETGFSLDGGGGTTALRTRITQSVAAYINALKVGDDVIFEKVKSRLFVPGVADIASVTVEGSNTNVAITSAPPEIARLNTVTLV